MQEVQVDGNTTDLQQVKSREPLILKQRGHQAPVDTLQKKKGGNTCFVLLLCFPFSLKNNNNKKLFFPPICPRSTRCKSYHILMLTFMTHHLSTFYHTFLFPFLRCSYTSNNFPSILMPRATMRAHETFLGF